jgi:hypothetical protein
MESVPDPLKDAVAGMAALLDEQVPDRNPDMFIQQLGSGVHHPEEQKGKLIMAPRHLNLCKRHRDEIRELLEIQERPNTKEAVRTIEKGSFSKQRSKILIDRQNSLTFQLGWKVPSAHKSAARRGPQGKQPPGWRRQSP